MTITIAYMKHLIKEILRREVRKSYYNRFQVHKIKKEERKWHNEDNATRDEGLSRE